MTQTTYRSHVGLHYTDEHGFRRVSMQLVNDRGYAVATAEFVNYGKVNRPCISCESFRTTDAASLAAVQWKNGLLSAPISEMLFL
jgi:hypothetical protein